MAGLSKDQIDELLANSRTKGEYKEYLAKFLDSDEAGINPAEAWPTVFGSKVPSTLYQGFTNAVKSLNGKGENLRVIKRDDSVFVIHTERYAVLTAGETESAGEDS